MYDIRNSSIFRNVDRYRAIPAGFLSILKNLSLVVFWTSFLVLSLQFLIRMLPADMTRSLPAFLTVRSDLFPALAWIFFSLWMSSALVVAFARQKLAAASRPLKGPRAPGENFAEYLDFEAAQTFKDALARTKNRFSTQLLLTIIRSGRLAFAFTRLCVKKNEFEHLILSGAAAGGQPVGAAAGSPDAVLECAARLAQKHGETKISIFILLLALMEIEPAFKKLLDQLEILEEDVESTALWQSRAEDYRKFRKKFWERDNLRQSFLSSPANDLIGGYTVMLDRYAHDLSRRNPLRAGGVVLHELQIEQLEETLTKQKGSSVLLVGETGSGRKSVIYNLANRVASENSSSRLKALRIMELDMVALVASNPDGASLAAALETIFEEAVKAGNVVIVIPQVHNYIGRQFGVEKLAAIDISGVISRYLKAPGFRVIGITTHEGFHKSIEQSAEAASMFAKIEVPPVPPADALRALKEESLRREKDAGLVIPIVTLREIVKLCDYFLGSAAFPEKAMTLLDDVIANKINRAGKTGKFIMPGEVDTYFSHKYEVPAGAAGAKERDTLVNLENLIHEGLINQKEAVSELANALRRSRAQISRQKKPIGNFLFLGPTGVGKTETAKQLAKVYFGSEKSMIRLDMAEYQSVESLTKMVGDLRAPGFLTSAVRDNPFSLVLIDEIEKAHPQLLTIFLSVFDEGEMTDGMGRPVDFRHTIIIATSNAGAEKIREEIGRSGSFGPDFKRRFLDNLLRNDVFKPEFMNRFDAIVLYRPLGVAEIEQVAGLMLAQIQEGLRQKRIELQITPELTRELGRLGFNPDFGARAMRRVIQDKVENAIASSLLSGSLRAGDAISVDPQTWQVVKLDKK